MKVAIVGQSTTRFSLDPSPIENVLVASIKKIFDETRNLHQGDIDTVLVSTNENKKYLSAIASETCGISPRISHTVESLCNSGTNALVSAYSYIASGLSEVALVVGAEKSDSPGRVLEWDVSRGEFTHPIFWASMFTKAHKRKYGTTEDEIATVAAKNYKNSIDNPNAYNTKAYDVGDILDSKKITDDIRLLDCSRPCTGGSAVLLASESLAKKFTDKPVWITGIGQKTVSASFARNDLTSLESTKIAATNAFAMAKTDPTQIDVFEVHDAFSICEIMILEEIGLAEKGQAGKYITELYKTADKKVNPRGGLIGTGHPLGATGLAQVSEIVQQIQQTAGKRQIHEAQAGLVHNMSAAATSSTVMVFKA